MTALPADSAGIASTSSLGQSFASHHGPIDLSERNVTVPKNWATGPMLLLAVLGLLCIGATLGAAVTAGADEAGSKAAKHALYAYHVGVMSIITFSVGGLGLTMILRAVRAGWSATIRRQAENVAMLIPLGVLLLIPQAIFAAQVWKWIDPAYEGGYLLDAKRWWLAPGFLGVRIVFYGVMWTLLAYGQYRMSTRQDREGDVQLTNKAQFWAQPGLLAFALTSSFAAFDLIMALDYHWFSTMFGVYFFAGAILSGVALVILITTVLRMSGRLRGVVTREHNHDLGKLLIAFTIFWAYISFSQYFLIWYANIPEATAWFLVRKENGWQHLFLLLCLGHFVLPFLLLLFRGIKKSLPLLAILAFWQLVMHLCDMFWQIRPVAFMSYDAGNPVVAGKVGLGWVDFTGVLGPVLLFTAGLIFMIRRSPLIATKDPRLVEALNHKNYV